MGYELAEVHRNTSPTPNTSVDDGEYANSVTAPTLLQVQCISVTVSARIGIPCRSPMPLSLAVPTPLCPSV